MPSQREPIVVALLQMASSGGNQEANLVKGIEFCRRAAAMGADIALFPEMWNIGYEHAPSEETGRKQWEEKAITHADPFVQHFRTLAKELDMAIVITYLERWEGCPRSSASLIDRHGEILLTYAKVHTCDFAMEAALTPGEDFYVTTLDTAKGAVKLGLMICYDREFPESARVLMLKGAELILVPNSCTLDEPRIGQLKTRAFENMVGVAMTNYAAPQLNGRSVAFDGVVYEYEDSPPRDTLIIEAGEDEGIYLAPFDVEKIREYRSRETWGNAYRKPRAYSILTSLEVEQPFVRTDDTRRGGPKLFDR